ncbi:MAG: site-2 protease family protein [Lachnospiraceae bacterium]|nr:site-2 protease family protein [Lachnospiraceae bacterium]
MEFNFWAILAFVIIFGVVVVAHEFGHFIVAKTNGIKVLEFSIGMGPKLVKFTKGDTEYSLRLLPIGGACMFEGEDGLYEEDEETERIQEENPLERPQTTQEGSFQNASVWVRIATVVAGPLFNIVLGYILAMIIVINCGSVVPAIRWVEIGYPAYEAGLRDGDVITAINGEKIHLFREIQINAMLYDGGTWEIEYERKGETFTTTLELVESDGSNVIGIRGGKLHISEGLDLFRYSWYEVEYWLDTTFKSLKMLVTGQLTKDDVAGPVGVAGVISDTIEETKAYGLPTVLINMVNIALLLSVNLGIMNLLPIPALDGGRLIFLLIEAVIRKPVPKKAEAIVHMIGFIALMLLMVLVLFNDVSKFFR